MNIVYRLEVIKPNDITSTIPHEILSDTIREFIEERGVKQHNYYFYDCNVCFFLYLDNGDRIDIEL